MESYPTTLQINHFYSLAKGYYHHVCILMSVCLSIILDHEQIYMSQPQFTCQIIDTDVLC